MLPKKERTRAQIMSAALRLFGRKDAAGTSIAEVSAEAEVANGTFYNYFRTKEELLEASALSIAEAMSGDVEERMSDMDDPAERMGLAGLLFFKQARKDSNWGWALIRVAAVAPRMSEILRSYPLKDIQKGIKIGKFSIDSEESALNIYVGALHYGIRSIIEGRGVKKNHDQDTMVLVLKAFGIPTITAKNIITKSYKKAWYETPTK